MLVSINPTLEWRLPPGATQYELVVETTDGPSVDLIRNAAESFTLPPPPQWYGLLPDMLYTWRVRSTDAARPVDRADASWSAWSEARSFRTLAVSTDALRLVQPADGAAVDSYTPTLVWSSSNSVIWYYEVQLSRDPQFRSDPGTATAPLYWELRHGGVTSPPNSYTVPPDRPLDPDTTYYWRVRPRIQGDGIPLPWSPAAKFTTPVRRVTLDDNGSTVMLSTDDLLLLDLGAGYIWKVRVDRPDVLMELPTAGIAAMPKMFRAMKAGTAKLSATGDPPCRTAQPPCLAPSLLFQLEVQVQAGTMLEPAPIVSLDVHATGGGVPEYVADVVSGLPNGCTQFDHSTVAREDDTFRISIFNRVQTDPNLACTAIYGYVNHAISLGSGLERGKMYTVDVNGVVRTFIA